MKITGNQSGENRIEVDSLSGRIRSFVLNKSVLLLFVLFCGIGVIYARQPANYIVDQVVTRFFRNIILILSLIVPVWAGMGLNFSIVVGAMSAQAGLIIMLNHRLSGIGGIAVAFAASIPIAVLLGWLTGRLFNKTKGQEMITGMILGYFANGVYQLIFMYLCGSIIPIKNQDIILSGMGINGTITFDQDVSGALDNLLKLTLDQVLWVLLALMAIAFCAKILAHFRNKQKLDFKRTMLPLYSIALAAVVLAVLLHFSDSFVFLCHYVRVPAVTAILVGLVCLFISFLSNTKLGSDIMTVGQNMQIARTAGIQVNRIRIIAIIISTMIAALGQVVYLQNLGTLTTYSAADQIGTFSVAALLVGGASIKKANIGQAICGAILFHLMFIVAPIAGKNIFGDALYGEYFRVFISYGVIAVALALHAWKTVTESRKK